MDTIIAIAAGLGAGAAAFLGGLLLCWSRRADRPGARGAQGTDPTELFLVDGKLTEASRQARQLLDLHPGETPGWEEIAAMLRPFFGPLPESPPSEPRTFAAPDDPETRLTLTPAGHSLHIAVTCPPGGAGACLRQRADRRELALLRRILLQTPSPIWQTDADRRVIWSNPGFADLCAQAGLPDHDTSPLSVLPDQSQGVHIARASVGQRGDGAQSWYEVQSFRAPDGWLHFGQNIDAVIHAEATQRNFLQTLTRIFAHLPIALAVFDKERRLVLFNPALIDLSCLSAEFLTGRPDMASFFDMLREKRIMPEPKNYRSWREKLSEVIAAASSDHYTETWNLPSGLTYRVTGRPHPDGGIAFLFEDISAEVSLTRRFRQEIEITQSVLDSLDDAVAVFSQMGVLTFCNDAYRRIWETDPDSAFAEVGIAEATLGWQALCRPSPIWAELRDFVLAQRDRAAWDADLETLGGAHLLCRTEPLVGGSTLVRFSLLPDRAVRRPERQSARA